MNSAPESQTLLAEARMKWFIEAHDAERKRYLALRLSTHGLLLQYDVQRAYSAGAWLSVIVLAQAAIEASIRDIGTQDYETKAKLLFEDNVALQRNRTLRNELVHPLPPGSPSIVWSVPGGDFAACHASLEPDAKLAVQLMFQTVYAYTET
jgi:hypothetical protein